MTCCSRGRLLAGGVQQCTEQTARVAHFRMWQSCTDNDVSDAGKKLNKQLEALKAIAAKAGLR